MASRDLVAIGAQRLGPLGRRELAAMASRDFVALACDRNSLGRVVVEELAVVFYGVLERIAFPTPFGDLQVRVMPVVSVDVILDALARLIPGVAEARGLFHESEDVLLLDDSLAVALMGRALRGNRIGRIAERRDSFGEIVEPRPLGLDALILE